MLKNMRLITLFDIIFNPSFKMTTSFANIARTTANTSKFIYYERFQIIRNWVFRCNKLKSSLFLKFYFQTSLQSLESLFLIWRERLPIYGNLK